MQPGSAEIREVALVDHHGRPVSLSDFGGSWCFVYFGFTHCRVVCPRSLARLSAALEHLRLAGRSPVAVYITVDPARDTPAVMKEFLEARFPGILGLTGTPEQTAAARRAFRVYAARRQDAAEPDGYAVPHTSFTYLLRPGCQFQSHFGEELSAQEVAARTLELMLGADQRRVPSSPGN